ncbi:MAG: hypothetical protein LBO66_12240 [Deltaproteobacteria bacterium]|jgi:hypothetical protein|nr:hypothetical protein [Deltaproteobacteria bacterium]
MSKTWIISIKFDYQKTRHVFSYEDQPEAPLPTPGQKKDLFTFRVTGAPNELKPEQIATVIANDLQRLNSFPGPYSLAFNIPWDRLCLKGAVSEERDYTPQEAAVLSERSISTIQEALACGKLAASRPAKMTRGHRPQVINGVDLKFYIASLGKTTRPKKGK